MPHMVEWYRKILLSCGMEMGRLPNARPLPRGRLSNANETTTATFLMKKTRMMHTTTPWSPNGTYTPFKARACTGVVNSKMRIKARTPSP